MSNSQDMIQYVRDLRSRIQEIALTFSSDYPNIESVSEYEQLWAIESAFEGTKLANQDLHQLIEKLVTHLHQDGYDISKLDEVNPHLKYYNKQKQ